MQVLLLQVVNHELIITNLQFIRLTIIKLNLSSFKVNKIRKLI